MTRTLQACIAAAIVAALSGCSPKPKLLKHYASDDAYTDAMRARDPACDSDCKLVERADLRFSAFVVSPKSPPTAPLLTQLGDRAQSELIRSAEKRLKSDAGAADLIALLARPPAGEDKGCGWADRTVFQRRIALTLLGELDRPADRVDRLSVSLSLDGDSTASFRSWDRFDSTYASFDLGSATFTQTDKLTLGRSATDTRTIPTPGGTKVDALSLGAESTNVLAETAAYSVRRLSLGGALSEKAAELVQEGGPYINLFGTSTATLTLHTGRSDDSPILHRLSLGDPAKPTAPVDVKVERCQSSLPATAKPIRAAITARATVRGAAAGDSTISEGDDTVTMVRVELDGGTETLVTSDDVLAEAYALVRCDRGQCVDHCDVVHIANPSLSPMHVEPIWFESGANAGAFREWLLGQARAAPGRVDRIAGREIGLDPMDLNGLSKRDVEALTVAVVWSNR